MISPDALFFFTALFFVLGTWFGMYLSYSMGLYPRDQWGRQKQCVMPIDTLATKKYNK